MFDVTCECFSLLMRGPRAHCNTEKDSRKGAQHAEPASPSSTWGCLCISASSLPYRQCRDPGIDGMAQKINKRALDKSKRTSSSSEIVQAR